MIRGILSIALLLAARAAAFEPTDTYTPCAVGGFQVLVHRSALAHTSEYAEAMAELTQQLERMAKTLPAGPISTLRTVRIWVEWEAKKHGAAEFHPSRDWLVANDYNPEKARCVEINNIRNFVAWSRRTQPCMVLHEFAHAYHFLVLGHQYAPVRAAWKAATDGGTYARVEFITGGQKRHYALTDDKEYFAELSESYFGKNDFFPFERAELRGHDPVGFAAVENAWGVHSEAPSRQSASGP